MLRSLILQRSHQLAVANGPQSLTYSPRGGCYVGTTILDRTLRHWLIEVGHKIDASRRNQLSSQSNVLFSSISNSRDRKHHQFIITRPIIQVLQSLRMLLLLKWSTLHLVSRQISYGLYELVKTGAANIHSETDWAVIFTLFEVVGAGAPLPKLSRTSEDTLVTSNGTSEKLRSLVQSMLPVTLQFDVVILKQQMVGNGRCNQSSFDPLCDGEGENFNF